MGPAADRAELLVHVRLRRERRQHQAADGIRPRRRRDTRAMSRRARRARALTRGRNATSADLFRVRMGRGVRGDARHQRGTGGPGGAAAAGAARFRRARARRALRAWPDRRAPWHDHRSLRRAVGVSTPSTRCGSIRASCPATPSSSRAWRARSTSICDDLQGRVEDRQDRDSLRGARPAAGRCAQGGACRRRCEPGARVPALLPGGEVTGHLLGFTDVDDTGQEGAELAFDNWLAGEDGAKRVIQDSQGNRVEDVESIRPVRPGRELTAQHRPAHPVSRLPRTESRDPRQSRPSPVRSWSWMCAPARCWRWSTSRPSIRTIATSSLLPIYRNRAATDLFEPGSSIKPFFVAAGLASGRYQANSIIDTSPGYIQVGTSMIHDEHNLGADPAGQRAGVFFQRRHGTPGALRWKPKQIWSTLDAFGFGQVTASGFPGESAGQLSNYSHWRNVSDRQHVARLRLVGDSAAA